MSKERQPGILDYPQTIIGKISGEYMLSKAKINVIDPNNSLDATKKFLNKGSVVVAFGHTQDDYMPMGKFTREIAPLNQAAVVIAWQYLDRKRNIKSFFKGNILRAWERGLGITLIPTVQDYDMEHYGKGANAINYRSTKDTLEYLDKEGHVLLIAPTGHRNEHVLGRAVEGVGAMLTRINPETTRILPTAIKPGSIQHGVTTDVFVGNLLSLREIENKRTERFGEIQKDGKSKQELKELKHTYYQQIADTLNIEIANLLPEQYRGENR